MIIMNFEFLVLNYFLAADSHRREMNGTFVQNVHNLNPDVDFILLDTDLHG
jgi:hypothetical protein